MQSVESVGDPALRAAAARFAEGAFAPHAGKWDELALPLPLEERRRLGSLGFLGLALPEEYGGSGADLVDAIAVLEEIAKVSQIAAFPVFEANFGPVRVIDLLGTRAQKERFLPPIASGEKVMALAMSEPDAGSAATDITTTARCEGGRYVVRGRKRWCSGAGHADFYLVYARSSDAPGAAGIGAFVVGREAPGLSFGPPEKLMGFHGIPSADILLEDVEIAKEDLIVGPGRFRDLFTAFSIERLGNATMSMAIGQACLDRTAQYVQERRQFGRLIVDFQLVQASLADMIMEVEAARSLIHLAASRAGRGAPRPLDASIAKCYANEMAQRVSDLAMQLHGGYGYAVDYGIERYHRDAHGWAIGGGTTNMQRIRIAAEYVGRRFEQRNARG